MSSGLSIYICVIVIGTLLAIGWLLYFTRNAPNEKEENIKKSHVYDGIEEYDNPLPTWWLYLFYATIAFGIGYLTFFPGLGAYKGVFDWSAAKQLEAEVEAADKKYAPIFAQHFNTPIKELIKKPEAVAMGQRLFGNHCSQCHGTDGGGLKGFPNLRDHDWLFGGDPDTIVTTIMDGRIAAMPAWIDSLKEEGVEEVTNYVLGLSGRKVSKILAERGEKKFTTFCAACHGTDAKGNMALGAPNLTDNIWQYGGSYQDVAETIIKGRAGQMPAFSELLGKEKVHIVSAYVYSLSQKQQDK
ncbi:MAG: cytochrome-c oxidase, cbb3-type subunit III [Pseudomonadota bacterium]